MKLNLPNAVTSRVAHSALVAKAGSPKVLFYTGLVLMGGTIVTACRGTLQLEGVLDDVRRERQDLQAVVDARPEAYSEREITKVNAYITGKGFLQIAKLYLPTVGLGVAAVACLTCSHNQLTRRNAGLSAALAATERALDKYRQRVRAEVGDDKELRIWRGEYEEKVPVLDADGNETKQKKTVKRGGGHSPYGRLWGQDTTNEWCRQPEYNVAKLRHVQQWATMILNSRGHIFLNEVLDELGLERSPEGAVVGWLSKKYGGHDGFVDLGVLKEGEEIQFLDFMTGDETHIWLDFNVDGEIWRNI